MSSLRTAMAHKFAFGLGYGGGPMRDQLTAERTKLVCESVARLGELGGWGVGVCADDLFVAGCTPHERSDTVARFLDALDGADVIASSTTTPRRHPAFRHGALTASERRVRRHALQQTVCAVDLAAELGAAICVVPPEVPAAPPVGSPIDALARYREAVEFVCGYIRDQGVAVRLALASPASATHGHALLPTVGHTLAFIGTLDEPAIVGVDVSVADTLSATPASYQGVVQLLAADKLLQVDLSLRATGHCRHEVDAGGRHAQHGGLENLFLLVKLLEESGWAGPRVLGSVAASVGDPVDAWEQHARVCMRTYLVLAAKARRFADDADIQDALVDCGADSLADDTVGPFTPGASRALRAESFDATEVADQDHRRAHLDQLVTELILGLR